MRYDIIEKGHLTIRVKFQAMKDLEESSFLSPVKNISVLLLIGGILSLFWAMPLLLFSPINGLFQLVIGVGWIVLSFGLRKMKKWGLYGFIGITVLSIAATLYSFLMAGSIGKAQIVITIIEVLLVIYFWKISKKFS